MLHIWEMLFRNTLSGQNNSKINMLKNHVMTEMAKMTRTLKQKGKISKV